MVCLSLESYAEGAGMWAVCLGVLLGAMGPPVQGQWTPTPKGCWASRLAAGWSSIRAPVGGGLCPALGTEGPGAL